jgi:hypothetical protein
MGRGTPAEPHQPPGIDPVTRAGAVHHALPAHRAEFNLGGYGKKLVHKEVQFFNDDNRIFF